MEAEWHLVKWHNCVVCIYRQSKKLRISLDFVVLMWQNVEKFKVYIINTLIVFLSKKGQDTYFLHKNVQKQQPKDLFFPVWLAWWARCLLTFLTIYRFLWGRDSWPRPTPLRPVPVPWWEWEFKPRYKSHVPHSSLSAHYACTQSGPRDGWLLHFGNSWFQRRGKELLTQIFSFFCM